MSDLFGNHIVGFPTRRLISAVRYAESQEKKADYLWERSILYEQQKEYTKSLEGYQRVLALLPPTDSERYFKLAWSLTRVSCDFLLKGHVEITVFVTKRIHKVTSRLQESSRPPPIGAEEQ